MGTASKEPQLPSIGRIVHYVQQEANETKCRAAVITEVDDSRDGVGVFVMAPSTRFFYRDVRYDEGKGPDTWHWPERV
jgi:hypothetical protein